MGDIIAERGSAPTKTAIPCRSRNPLRRRSYLGNMTIKLNMFNGEFRIISSLCAHYGRMSTVWMGEVIATASRIHIPTVAASGSCDGCGRVARLLLHKLYER